MNEKHFNWHHSASDVSDMATACNRVVHRRSDRRSLEVTLMKSGYHCGYCRTELDETNQTIPNGEVIKELTCMNPECAFYTISR